MVKKQFMLEQVWFNYMFGQISQNNLLTAVSKSALLRWHEPERLAFRQARFLVFKKMTLNNLYVFHIYLQSFEYLKF